MEIEIHYRFREGRCLSDVLTHTWGKTMHYKEYC